MADLDIWQPLRRRAFFWLWAAAVVSNVGTWMHDTAAAWTMATLAPSPLMVSLMQPAMTFPFGVLAVLANWRRERKPTRLPPERVIGAMRAGVRYVRHATGYHAVLVRDAAFVLSASAVWALLPLVARTELHLDASGYGLVLGGLGVGAIAGGLALPRLRGRVSLERLLVAATLLFAV